MTYRNLICITCIAGSILCGGAVTYADQQADQPVGTGAAQQSPFSLESSAPAVAANLESQAVNRPAPDSPFALPDPGGQNEALAPSAPDSPFALPAPGTQAVAEDTPTAPGSTVEPVDDRTAAELLAEGMEMARAGKFEEARVALAQSVRKDPENVVALNNLGLVLRRLERLDDALRAYQYALQVDGTYALTYKNLGVLLEKRGEKELAVQAYREYCRLAPGAEDARDVTARADWLENRR